MRFKKPEVTDDNAAHQIRLNFGTKPGSKTVGTVVTCTCMETYHGALEPIAFLEPGDEPWEHFNNPDNHRDLPRPFMVTDMRGPNK
jgi:hypothetical protein